MRLLASTQGFSHRVFRPFPSMKSAQNGEPVIEFRNAIFCLRDRDGIEKKILDSLNLTVSGGETVVLLGRSGAGKTTALKLINRLLEPTSGEVRVEGKPTVDWDAIE